MGCRVKSAWGSPARIVRKRGSVGVRSDSSPHSGPPASRSSFRSQGRHIERLPASNPPSNRSRFGGSGVGRSQVHARRLVRLQRSTGDSRLIVRPFMAESVGSGRRFISLRWSTRVVSRFGASPISRALRVARLRAHSRKPAVSGVGVREVEPSFDEASRVRGSPVGALPAPLGCNDIREARFRDYVVRGQSERNHRRHQRPAKAVAAQERGIDFEARNASSNAIRPGKGHAARRRLGRGRTVESPRGAALGRAHDARIVGAGNQRVYGYAAVEGGWQMPATRRPPTDVHSRVHAREWSIEGSERSSVRVGRRPRIRNAA